jgi:hypothetical protein
MDEDRKVRFSVAPILFAASLLVGALLDQQERHVLDQFLNELDLSKSIGLIAGGGALVFAAGYAIGTCTQFLMRLIFQFRPRSWGKSRFHEVALSDDSFGLIWERIGAPPKPDRSQELFAGAVFDHGVLRKDWEGVHRWLFRRWNGFNTATNSISALILSLLIGWWIIGIPWSLTWGLSVLISVFILGTVAFWSWHDTMNMVGFMASLKKEPAAADNNDST